MQLTREKGQRMWGGGGSSIAGGGGGGGTSLAGYATESWVDDNYLSKEFWSELFVVNGLEIIETKASGETEWTQVSSTVIVFTPNEIPSQEESTDETTGTTTRTTRRITNIKVKTGLWTEQFLSALGLNAGGGGGGTTLNEPLSSINSSGLAAPGSSQDGMTVVWDNTQQKWKYGSAGGGGGSTAWADITGKPTTIAGYGITDAKIVSGTITLGADSITPLTSSDISDMATQTWVGQQGFALASNVYSKTDADQKFMTIAAFENLFNALASDGTTKVIHPYASGVASIKAMVGLWTEQYLSALGQNSGGGGGVPLNEPLASINTAGLGTPTATGQVITWNGSQWIYSIPGGGGGGGTGTVTSITAGTGLSGGTITTMGTIALSTETQTNIGYGVTAYGWGNHANAGYLTSVSFSDLTSHPTTLGGYGITDAKIQNGTITLGSKSITPLTSFTETDPTVPAWAKASTKPSYSFSEITGTIASSQLPTLYWANVEVSSSSSDTTEPKMKSLHLYGSGQFGVGGLLKFGDGDYVYLAEEADDKLTIKGNKGIFLMPGSSYYVGIGTDSPSHKLDVVGDINATLDITTAQAVNARNIELSFTSPFIDFHHASSSADYTSRLITTDYGTLNLQSKTSGGTDKLSGFVVGANYDGSFIQIGNIKIVYDSSNNALKIIKSDGTAANLYATGGVSALGTT